MYDNFSRRRDYFPWGCNVKILCMVSHRFQVGRNYIYLPNNMRGRVGRHRRQLF